MCGNLKEWHVVLRTKDGNVALDFVDTTEIAQQILRPTIIDELLEYVNNRDNYYVSTSVVEVTSPDGEDYTDKQIYVLLAKSKRHGVAIGYLFGEFEIGDKVGLMILGLWPKEFSNIVKNDREAHLRALASILVGAEEWEAVDLAIPASNIPKNI